MTGHWANLFRYLFGKGDDLSTSGDSSFIVMRVTEDTSGTHKKGYKYRKVVFESEDGAIKETRFLEWKEESDTAALKVQMERAIKNEDYEEAARLRDEINKVEDEDNEGTEGGDTPSSGGPQE